MKIRFIRKKITLKYKYTKKKKKPLKGCKTNNKIWKKTKTIERAQDKQQDTNIQDKKKKNK